MNVVKASQPEKVDGLMLDTLLGIVTEIRLQQSSNIFSPMLADPSAIMTLVIDWWDDGKTVDKENCPGIATDVIEGQSLNASRFIVAA